MHTALNARSSPAGVLMRIPGLLPNLKIWPVLAATSVVLKGRVTEFTADSASTGGIQYRTTG